RYPHGGQLPTRLQSWCRDSVRILACPAKGRSSEVGMVEERDEHGRDASQHRAVTRRVAGLPAGAEALARAVAVLGGPAWLRHAAALAGQDMEAAGRLADALRAAGGFARGAR